MLTHNLSFVKEGDYPYDRVVTTTRDIEIKDKDGEIVYSQKDVVAPEAWSDLAVRVFASKYFHGEGDDKENNVFSVINRVVDTITIWASADGYFEGDCLSNFNKDLKWLLIHQHGAFNSPVWFNLGINAKPQTSACFIQSVDDTMESIMELATSTATLFKNGSGTGTNFSTIRSSYEGLSGGGIPSGPLSFMEIYDKVGNVVKSGGRNRRAASMNVLDISHPDILEFIKAKSHEEKKAHALIDQGYDGSFGGEAYRSVMFQNSNFSVSLTDKFMNAVEGDGYWHTKAVHSDVDAPVHDARKLLREIAKGTWECGDPGVLFHDTINRDSGIDETIMSSNPCGEFLFVNDSACNLASLNLVKFMRTDPCRMDCGNFDYPKFKSAVRIFTIAQDILIDRSSYPTKQIEDNSKKYRPIGLGYSNLGGLLMRSGLAYDSDEGRSVAADITMEMRNMAETTSLVMGADLGCNYKESVSGTGGNPRNAQLTLLAPTGTIGFIMDCDTTGIEPEIALTKYKNVDGEGTIMIANQATREALESLSYAETDITAILECVSEHGTVVGSVLKEEHLDVFDCALEAGGRTISPMGHMKMMEAVQPFLSGGISKTVNVPEDTTVDEITEMYKVAWKMGLKGLAVYRDGSKKTQPLNTVKKEAEPAEVVTANGITEIAEALKAGKMAATSLAIKPLTKRRKLPMTRQSITHKFDIAGHEGYVHVGVYEDGTPGEMFITMSKEGSTIGGLMDSFATSISLCFQHGVALDKLVEKFSFQQFDPQGMTGNRAIPFAKSIVDYIFRWMAIEFKEKEELVFGPGSMIEPPAPVVITTEPPIISPPYSTDRYPTTGTVTVTYEDQAGTPPCPICGSMTVRNGACHKCQNCGESLGCS